MNPISLKILRQAADDKKAEVERIEASIVNAEEHLSNMRLSRAEAFSALRSLEDDIRAAG